MLALCDGFAVQLEDPRFLTQAQLRDREKNPYCEDARMFQLKPDKPHVFEEEPVFPMEMRYAAYA